MCLNPSNKYCPLCKKDLDISNFKIRKQYGKNHYNSYCNTCKRDKLTNYKNNKRSTKEGILYYNLSNYKNTDKRRGFNFDLDLKFLIELCSKPCIYCGDTEKIGADRIDNNKGHTKDNVVPCCFSCNKTRLDLYSFEEMLILGKAIREIKLRRRCTT